MWCLGSHDATGLEIFAMVRGVDEHADPFGRFVGGFTRRPGDEIEVDGTDGGASSHAAYHAQHGSLDVFAHGDQKRWNVD